MATIEYKCDTCKREITLLENTQGMTIFAKCIITEGCKGTLYKQTRNRSLIHQNLNFPTPVTGLNDFIPRRGFYEANINITANPWKIEHNLGVSPAVTVYFFDDLTQKPFEVSPDEYSIVLVDKNNLEIHFSNQQKGIAHLISRSSVPREIETIIPTENLLQISNNGFIDMAVPSVLNDGGVNRDITNDNASFSIEMVLPDNPKRVRVGEYLIDGVQDDSAWNGWNEIFLRQRKNFSTKNFNVETPFIEEFNNISSLSEVPNNTILRILQIEYKDIDTGYNSNLIDIEPRSVFILLSRSPFQPSDRIRNQLIDVGELLIATSNFFVVIDGEVFIDRSNVETIYPNIRRIS